MNCFDYIKPKTIAEATDALAKFGSSAQVLAGGTDVLIELRRANGKTPQVVIDIAGIQELNGLLSANGTIILKPLATHSQLSSSTELNQSAQLLSIAAASIGSPQIRNRGTVGGNVMNAATCADTVPPLVALGAKVKLQSADGERLFDMADFFIKPYKTKASPNELLTEIQFQKLPLNARSVFIKLGRRNALSISRLSVAAVVAQDESGVITDARIVPGAAFPTWRRVAEAEHLLIGEKPSKELLR
ncbi:MAG: FAD binding domain-containing protein, partial [Ignavibacteriae bacterium]|nr:FAD binding domain-containing protein [Ignavibacteriota bacterium]